MNKITIKEDIKESLFNAFKKFKNLETLIKIDSKSIDDLQLIECFHNLKRLIINDDIIDIDQNSSSIISSLKQNSNLTELDVYYYKNNIFDYIASNHILEKLEIHLDINNIDVIYLT